jgi:hypothetical protein
LQLLSLSLWLPLDDEKERKSELDLVRGIAQAADQEHFFVQNLQTSLQKAKET